MYNAQPPVMLPPLHYQGMDSAQPFGYQPPGASGMHPTRMAALAAANNVIQSVQAGMVRSADEMDGGGGPDDIPPAKRQRVAKLPGGALYPEEDWIAMHPVSRVEHDWISFGRLTAFTASYITTSSNAQRPFEARVEATRPDCHDSRFTSQPSCFHASRSYPTAHQQHSTCLPYSIILYG